MNLPEFCKALEVAHEQYTEACEKAAAAYRNAVGDARSLFFDTGEVREETRDPWMKEDADRKRR